MIVARITDRASACVEHRELRLDVNTISSDPNYLRTVAHLRPEQGFTVAEVALYSTQSAHQHAPRWTGAHAWPDRSVSDTVESAGQSWDSYWLNLPQDRQDPRSTGRTPQWLRDLMATEEVQAWFNAPFSTENRGDPTVSNQSSPGEPAP